VAESTIFILSPANASGVRARQLTAAQASFAAARSYQSTEGVRIDEAFSFMSALYFRGKIAYATRFARSSSGNGVHVIAPGFGLVSPDWRIDRQRMRRLRNTAVDARKSGYRKSLETSARALVAGLPDDARIVLLGSIATGKYVDILWPLLGSKLLFPAAFVGLGDMSRGAMMLRSARTGEELEYTTLDVPRHRPRSSSRLSLQIPD
jgi:hypothetical protein